MKPETRPINPPVPTEPREHLSEALISLPHLDFNLSQIKELLPTSCDIMGVVKANAYGHGAPAIARRLLQRGVRNFGVANIHEAIELRRKGGIDERSEILAFCSPPPSHLPYYLQYRTALTATDPDLLCKASSTAANHGSKLDVHVKVDTGMGRLGLPPNEAMQLLQQVEKDPNLRLCGIYTHFAQGTTDDEFSRSQLARFREMCREFEHWAARPVMKHAAGSGALLCLKDAFLDMVRPGIMLYGCYPAATVSSLIELKPVMQLESRVMLVKTVERGTTLSYNRSWTAPQRTRIATVAAGYADGYHRLLSNRSHVMIRGKLCPQVGNITMDQMMVDIGNDTCIAVGDKVVLFGWQGPCADELATLCNSISYELLCSVSSRVTRTVIS
ncbi:alanine racemase [Prosthecochloris sp. HL-130-GSB]|uniref:alanine racemase n=1 Tax=Prosthecochloris sp. HL-130-GSB TaxID=1974213 RepID=UPI001E2D22FF|nr:alanine racemase [Prosthecochloris sp. HL-130-GSB]